MKSFYLKYCKGQIAIIVAISLIVLIGMVGLAIDSGRGYGVKAKLSAAVDAAAIAAARGLTVGDDDAERLANAQASAQKFFNGNFPNSYLGATPTSLNTTAVHKEDGYWQVNVSATANMPTTFMRVLGQNEVNVSAAGEAIRRDVDIMLVMDTSGSIGSAMTGLKNCAKNSFVSKFISGPGGDRLGLVSFASGAVLDVPINKDATRGFNKTQMNNAIDAFTSSGWTASAEGMRRALNEINLIPASTRSSLRAIVFFSDGAPNAAPATFTRTSGSPNPVTGDLESGTSGSATGRANELYREDRRDTLRGTYTNIATLPNTGLVITGVGGVPLASYNNVRTLTGSPITNTRCNVNKAARNMVENIANTSRGQSIYVHSASLGSAVNNPETSFSGGCSTNSEVGSTILKRLANSTDSTTYNAAQPTGIYVSAATIAQCDEAFSKIASEILRLTK
ncbi:MAG: VWA domain-containing protein [Methylotenera sp.]|nr:VWA domain-containing protein [Methylotenera sp.]